ncbi:MAG: hypothetical protein KF689_06500 [Gemmatimonadaceae bacterium]|nr:hypothetical protein [Gemmatimonadaceae bacterium]MCW5825176.1 hypothetical protein [Gemmatimonadaceae bacterium]
MKVPRLVALLALSLSPVLRVAGQSAAPSAPSAPVAAAADVASIDAIIDALYASISGPAGQPRDWDRLRSLMAPAELLRGRP